MNESVLGRCEACGCRRRRVFRTVTRHRCLASRRIGTQASYYLTVEFPEVAHG